MANTDPILTSESSVDRGFWNKGSLQVDGDFILPVTDNDFTNPDLRDSGKLRYNDVDGFVEHNNGFGWVKQASLNEEGIVPDSQLPDYKSVDFNFNNVTIPNPSTPVIDLGATIGFREMGNPVFDDLTNQWICPYSFYTKPYTSDGAKIGMMSSPTGNIDDWSDEGEIISTPSEDPNLKIWNGFYYIWCEKKGAGVNLDIELFKSSSPFSGYSSLGVVLERGTSGQPDNIDVSSPTPDDIDEDGTTRLYYEGRGSGNTIGSIMLATAPNPEGPYTKYSTTTPLIYGYQFSEEGQWYAGGVPDDIKRIGNARYMMTHMWNGDAFGPAVFISEDEEGVIWRDYLQTWMNTGKNNEITSQGVMMYQLGRQWNCFLISSEMIYGGNFNVAKNDNVDYIVRTGSTTTTNKIKGASRNQIIEANISSNATFVIGRDDSTLDGCIKEIRNTSAFTLTLDPDTDVTINGSTSNFDILAGQMCKMYTTAANTWKIFVYQDALVSGTSLKTIGGISLLGSGNVTEVQNNLTASTTLAPSATAVNTALATKFDIPAGSTANYIRGDGSNVNLAAPVRATTLSGFVAGSGTITTGDSILTAFNKLVGNQDLKAPLSSPALTGTPTAPTAPLGTNTTQVATTAGVLAEIGNATGWAQYSGSNYTSGSPLVINSGNTSVLANNGVTSTINTQLPTGVTAFVNTSNGKITPQNDGDFYVVDIRFKATSSAVDGVIDIGIDIGGAMGVIREHTVSLRKGIGVEQRVALSFPVFSGSTFVANGGEVKVTSIAGNTSVYDVTFVVSRTHKAK